MLSLAISHHLFSRHAVASSQQRSIQMLLHWSLFLHFNQTLSVSFTLYILRICLVSCYLHSSSPHPLPLTDLPPLCSLSSPIPSTLPYLPNALPFALSPPPPLSFQPPTSPVSPSPPTVSVPKPHTQAGIQVSILLFVQLLIFQFHMMIPFTFFHAAVFLTLLLPPLSPPPPRTTYPCVLLHS